MARRRGLDQGRRSGIRAALAAVLALAWAGTAAAAEEKGKDKEKAPSEADLRLDITGLGLPVLENGRVINFIFVRIRINMNPGISKPDIDAGDPFIRERVLRAAYRTPLNTGNELMALDTEKLTAVTLREARAYYGAARVRSVEIRDQKPQKRIYRPPSGQGRSGGVVLP